ncbi:MAG: hypothetical protein LBO63_06220 [Oscillospiraceae bacterium]|jgi:hypothetical protein|nr:hypothetical protein [Oscillospiraceae bacterium]
MAQELTLENIISYAKNTQFELSHKGVSETEVRNFCCDLCAMFSDLYALREAEYGKLVAALGSKIAELEAAKSLAEKSAELYASLARALFPVSGHETAQVPEP